MTYLSSVPAFCLNRSLHPPPHLPFFRSTRGPAGGGPGGSFLPMNSFCGGGTTASTGSATSNTGTGSTFSTNPSIRSSSVTRSFGDPSPAFFSALSLSSTAGLSLTGGRGRGESWSRAKGSLTSGSFGSRALASGGGYSRVGVPARRGGRGGRGAGLRSSRFGAAGGG